MAEIDWNSLAENIAGKIWSAGRTVDLNDETSSLLESSGFAIDSQTVIEQFDRIKQRVSRSLLRRISQCEDAAIIPRLKPCSVDPDLFNAQSHSHSDGARKEMAEAIRKVSWRQFEHLCAFVLKLNGVAKCHPMRGTKEEGIDIFGEIDLGKVIESTIWHGVIVRILGQAKIGKIPEKEVRLFSQDLRSFTKGEGRAFGLAPQWFKASRTPVIGFMLTADRPTRDAKAWAERQAIGLKDCTQIAEDLLRRPDRVPGIIRAGEQLTFDAEAFRSFVASLNEEPNEREASPPRL